MASLQVAADQDFSKDLLSGIATIEFVNAVGPATANFGALQVDDVQIMRNAAIVGNGQSNNLVFQGGSISLRYFTFSNWTNGADTITIIGSNSANSLTGSSRQDFIEGKAGNDTIDGRDGDDVITGGGGRDTLRGRGGNDTFRFEGNDASSGEIIDGGADQDRVSIISGPVDFTTSTLVSIEEIEFEGITGLQRNVTLLDTQIGGSSTLQTVIGSTAINDVLIVRGSTIDNSGVTYINWDGVIRLQGISASPGTIIGGSENEDILDGGNAAYLMAGGDGDDFIQYTANTANGDRIDGGDGTDSLVIFSLTDDVFDLTGIIYIVQMETLRLSSTIDTTVTLTTSLFSDFETVRAELNSGDFTLTINADGVAPDTDLAAVNFINWTLADNTIKINGTATANILTGSVQNDTIDGKGAADTLDGGAGDDTIRGGGGGDTITGGLGKDTMTGGAGNDLFMFTDAAESAVGNLRDRITDFTQGADRINVSAMASFTFIGGTAFDGSGNAELRFIQTANGTTTVQGDVDGNGTRDFEIRLDGLFTLLQDDFVL